MEGWMDGWKDGWMEAKAGLRIAYSNQKFMLFEMSVFNFVTQDRPVEVVTLPKD